MPLDTFKTYNELNEKQIVFNKGKRFGQAVFVAGGAGSGKGFAIQNFLDSSKFKIRDIDSYKSALISLDQIASDAGKKTKQKGINAKEKYGLELRNFKMNNPKDVFMLHKLAKEIGLDKKSLNLLLGNAKNPETLPNIIFDVTFKDIKKNQKTIETLLRVGYQPENIHLVWVLTNYQIAIDQNAERERVVPMDIMLQTHKGAAMNMISIIKGNIPRGINGGIHVILGNKENTIYYQKNGKNILTGKDKQPVIKSFTDLTIKNEGKPFVPKLSIQMQMYDWLQKNIPKGVINKRSSNMLDMI